MNGRQFSSAHAAALFGPEYERLLDESVAAAPPMSAELRERLLALAASARTMRPARIPEVDER
ncbi:hypothetical protein [Streptomyces fagopyri]